ncbi:MAG: hypothetical protein WCW02_03340 [Candidatus Buchananbacteria bacterium]
MKKIFLSFGLFAFVLSTVFFLALPVFAATCTNTSGTVVANTLAKPGTDNGWYFLSGLDTDCFQCGNCDICDLIKMYIGASNWMISAAGAVALAAIIWGALLWLVSAGNSQMIEKGKNVIKNTVFALAILLGAWMLVNTIVNVLTNKSLSKEGQVNYGDGFVAWSIPSACQNDQTK